MAEKRKPEKAKPESSRNVQAGRDVTKSVVVTGDNNVIHYYVGGEKREMRTGWFFGHRYGD